MELNIVKKILPKEDILVLLKMFDRESEPSLSSHIDLDKWSIKLENAVFIHCYLNGEIIGTLAYYIGEYIFITHIAVKSEYRRLHVAQKMLDSLLLTAKKDIKLIVRKDNVAAIKFYEKNHFQLSEEDNNEYVLIRKAEPSNVHQYEVCVHCPTYNHSLYIEDCLSGFIMQKTTFPFCVVIVDDASADGNQEIIKQYAEKYPDIIKPVLLLENHFSQKKSKRPYYSSYDEQSKYVAMCEGDDYWTDPLKLQKQVDFLEANPEYSMCCNATRWLCSDNKTFDNNCNCKLINCDLSTAEILEGGGLYINLASVVYRNIDAIHEYRKSNWWSIADIGDFPLCIAASLIGKVRYFSEIMCVYRYQHPGSWTDRNKKVNIKHLWNEITWLQILDEETKYKYQGNIRKHLFKFWRSLYRENQISTTQYIHKYNEAGRLISISRFTKDIIRRFVMKFIQQKNKNI